MSITNSRKIKLGAAAAVLMGLAFAAQSAVLTWDAGNADDRIDRTTNWNPDGLPTVGVNSGVVNGSFATTYFNAQTPAYEIAYNDTSSLSGSTAGAALTFSDGADFTFNDSSTLTVGGTLYVGSASANTGPGALTLTGNATATAGSGLRFGYGGPTGTDYSGTLTLRGNSTLTTSGAMYWQQRAAQASLTHYLTLADSAALTVNNNDVRSYNSASIVVNFQQSNNLYTPTWTLGETNDFNQATIQYQINGTNTTLNDSRFVLTGSSLSLNVIPEPATIGMLGLGALVTLLVRRMGTR